LMFPILWYLRYVNTNVTAEKKLLNLVNILF
jgi:hypothetical protein